MSKPQTTVRTKNAIIAIVAVIIAGCWLRGIITGSDKTPAPSPTAVAAAPPATPITQLPTSTRRPSPTAAPTQTPTPTPTHAAAFTHTVQSGDTLAAIAAEYGLTWQQLAAANNIDDPATLRPGQQLIIHSEQSITTAPPPSPTSAPPAAPPATPIPDPLTQQASVVDVVDGDTIKVDIGGETYTVRYIGIDTPETVHPDKPVEPFGPEASAANAELVEGQTVTLEKDVSETDQYGRLLRYVWIGDMLVNEELVLRGYAQASTWPPDVKHQERFIAAQQAAISAGAGLWGAEIEMPSRSNTPIAVTDNGYTCDQCIKGNISRNDDEHIYHIPGCDAYDKTKIDTSNGERWFSSEAEAIAAGWRKAENCP